MASLKEEAEFQRLALALTLTDVDAVVAWADRMIVTHPDPPIQIIDVALAGSRFPDEVADLLAKVPGETDLTAVAHEVLALFWQRFSAGEVSLERAVNMLWTYHDLASIPEDERMTAGDFREMYFCVEQGYCGTIESLRDQVAVFAATHSGEAEKVIREIARRNAAKRIDDTP